MDLDSKTRNIKHIINLLVLTTHANGRCPGCVGLCRHHHGETRWRCVSDVLQVGFWIGQQSLLSSPPLRKITPHSCHFIQLRHPGCVGLLMVGGCQTNPGSKTRQSWSRSQTIRHRWHRCHFSACRHQPRPCWAGPDRWTEAAVRTGSHTKTHKNNQQAINCFIENKIFNHLNNCWTEGVEF